MKVLVYGGSGFLGSSIVDELTRSGFDVSIFDMQPPPQNISYQKYISGNILDYNNVLDAAKDFNYILNFAGLADINDAKDKPMETIRLNIEGNLNILEASKTVKAERFVYASSLYVYSNSGSFYRASKQASERYIEAYSSKYGLPFTILRFGSLYGHGSDCRNNIYRLISQALSSKKMEYPGTGNEIREYIHVADAAKATVQALDKEFENQHIVLTGHQQLRIKDLMIMISEILGDKIEHKFTEDIQEYHYNITPYIYRSDEGEKWNVENISGLNRDLRSYVREAVMNTMENTGIRPK